MITSSRALNKLLPSILLACALPGMAGATELNIDWIDNSNNEDGFKVERRLGSDADYLMLTQLPENTTQYNDADILTGETYCYRISAYNDAGQAASGESCIEVPDDVVVEPAPVEPAPVEPPVSDGNVAVSHSFIAQPGEIELAGKEFYGFKSDYSHNTEFSADEISDVNFNVDQGSVYYRDSTSFVFMQEGSELENGYASMAFNSNNSVDFMLEGSGSAQTATLYMAAGAWSKESSSIIITAGDKTETVTLPYGYSWHYFTVDIEFDGTTPVTITTDSDRGGYSGVMFAGIVLNQESEQIKPAYGVLQALDMTFGKHIEVTGSKYVTSEMQQGNDDSSTAQVSELTYTGATSYRNSEYVFVEAGQQQASGYRGMSWDENNSLVVTLTSGDNETHTASLYFKAGAWTHDVAAIELTINGESRLIELSSGYSWHYIKADIEFEGEVQVELKPVGKLGGYSGFGFAGITLN